MANNIRHSFQTPNSVLQVSIHPSFMAVEEGFVHNLGILSEKTGELTEYSRVRCSESPASSPTLAPSRPHRAVPHVTIIPLSHFSHFCSPLLIMREELLHISQFNRISWIRTRSDIRAYLMVDGSTEDPNQTWYWNQAKGSSSSKRAVFHFFCVGAMEDGEREQEEMRVLRRSADAGGQPWNCKNLPRHWFVWRSY